MLFEKLELMYVCSCGLRKVPYLLKQKKIDALSLYGITGIQSRTRCCLQVEALVFSSGGFAVTAAYSSMHRWAGCDSHRCSATPNPYP